jgi:KipI family sensor histidine kinase inhibitor
MTPRARLLPYGDRAVLVELGPDGDVPAWANALRRATHDIAGVVDIVPAARTVLVVVDPDRVPLDSVRALVERLEPGPADRPTGPVVEIPVRYDGADLMAVAAATGLDVEALVSLHAAPTYTAAFCGFAPGFAYLTGLDPRLHLPRRATPRPKVPKGSVAIAAGSCGIYPNDMPGGWHLLGSTDVLLWDLSRTEPALLTPGTRVRFRPVDRTAGG